MQALTQQTAGLVLHTVPYGESSVIARIFTRQLGLRSYVVKGVRSAKGRAKQNLLQPLSYLDMVVYCKQRDINYIKEMQPARQWQTLDTQPLKTAIRFFASETLYKSLRSDDPTPRLFDYVVDTMQILDSEEQSVSAYPIKFLIGLSRQLGIEPLDNYSSSSPCFNMREGRFGHFVMGEHQLSHQQSHLLHEYLQGGMPTATLEERRYLLSALLDYYRIHLSDFGGLKSHEVLHAVLE